MGKIKKKILIIIAILIFFGFVGIIEEINLIAQGQASFDDWRVVVGNALTEIILCWLFVFCIIAIPADVVTKGDAIPRKLFWVIIFISLVATILLGLLATGGLGISGSIDNQTINGINSEINGDLLDTSTEGSAESEIGYYGEETETGTEDECKIHCDNLDADGYDWSNGYCRCWFML